MRERYDAVVVGGGHNGLVAAAYLARAGRSVLLLERRDYTGGAAISAPVFEGLDARLSRYAYLVSLVPAAILRDLGVALTLRRRRVASYTPCVDGRPDGLLLAARHPEAVRRELRRLTRDPAVAAAWSQLAERAASLARAVWPSLTQPLVAREELRRRVGDDAAWAALVDEPLGAALEPLGDDLVQGVVATDGLIGTFASVWDASLAQNRCFLYHVIGGGTGDWDVPVGGMGALTDGLAERAAALGAEVVTGAEVIGVAADGRAAEVTVRWQGDEQRVACDHVLSGVAPRVLASLLGEPAQPLDAAEAGAQLKLNLLLARLPRLRDVTVSSDEAFAGTFHANQSLTQLETAYAQAAAGRAPALPPCEAYCHSLTDSTILGPRLRGEGAQTLTVFGLHQAHHLFTADPGAAKAAAVEATLRSLNTVLAEPIEDCLYRMPDSSPCLEAATTVDLEAGLGLPGGNIFHRPPQWPFAEDDDEVGRWGVETARANVWLCGAGARRGGGVSGIPGHNAAMAVLAR